jgi:hypothetical protein
MPSCIRLLLTPALLLGLATAVSAQTQFISAHFLVQDTPAFPNGGLFAVGDVNADGKSDIVVVVDSFDGPETLLLRGKGDGTFVRTALDQPTSGALAFQLADMNGDGLADLLAFDEGATDRDGTPIGPGTLDIYLNTGHDTFRSIPVSSTTVGVTPNGLFVKDVNRDGKPDVVVGSQLVSGHGGTQILLNNGTGKLTQANMYTQYRSVLGVGDFTGDGKVDLLVQGAAGVTFMRGQGNGSFAPGRSFGYSGVTLAVGVGDFNRDGHLDFAVASGWQVGIFLGDGAGGFRRSATVGNPQPVAIEIVPTIPLNVVVVDFDRDGELDLAIATSNHNGTNPLTVFFGNGNGTFATNKYYGVSSPYGVAAADFNRDGDIDLVSGGVTLMLGSRYGIFNAAPITYTPRPQSIVAADFNGDHIKDVAVVNEDPNSVSCTSPCRGSVTVLAGTGKGYFASSHVYPIVLPHGTLSAGDVNGDGHVDLVVTRNTIPLTVGGPPSGTTDTVVLLGNGDGSFRSPENYVLLGSVTNDNNTAYLLDVNRDGKLDLVGDWGVALGNGDGSFRPPIPLPSSLTNIAQIIPGDLNRDGKEDLAVLGSDNADAPLVWILLGNGKGTFRIASKQLITDSVGALAFADLNRDGKLDLIYTTSGALNAVNVKLGHGDGTLGPAKAYPTDLFGTGLVTADFNRDGFTDVAIAGGFDFSIGFIRLLHGKGDGTLTPSGPAYVDGYQSASSITFGTNADGEMILALDINSDGAPDILDLTTLGVERLVNTGKR